MDNDPAKSFTEDEVRAFRDDGVVCLHGLFAPEWVELLRALADARLGGAAHAVQTQELATDGAGRFFNDMFLWQREEGFRDVVFDSPAAAIAGALMGAGRVNVLFDQLLIKEPATEEPTPWHHDLPFWPFRGDQVCTLWLALDPVSASSGAVEYIRGSHRWGKRFQPASFVGDGRYQQDGLEPMPDFEAQRTSHGIVRFELAPGDCTVHHGLTVHGAPGNDRPDVRRRAYVTRWAGDDVTYDPRAGTQPMLRDPGIAPGAPVDCDLWPTVWRRAA